MHEVAIVGSGELGGELAYALARRDVASRIRLIGDGQVAAGKALDITQAAAVEGFATRVLAGRDVSEAAGAAAVVLTVEGDDDPELALLQRIAQSSEQSVIVCAAASHRTLVERAVVELRVARRRIIGTAPEALASALRALVALEVNGSPRDVGLTVLGVPPSQVVVPWDDATIGGLAATRLLDEPARRRLASRVAPLWPPGPRALASAATAALTAVLGQSRRQVSAFVGPDRDGGQRTRAVALPVRLGSGGIEEVVSVALDARDRVALDSAMML